MNYLRSGIKTIVGQNGASAHHGTSEGAQTVERLVDRLQTATILEDRRDALRALKSLSKRFRLEVGTQAMDTLLEILRNPASSNDILSYAVESLSNVIGGDADEEENEYSEAEAQDLGERFTEIFIKTRDNINLVISLIENFEFSLRLHAIRLLTSLLRHRPKDVQEHLLLTPGAIPKITDLLSENREVIRNDAVLLVYEMVRGNANIQKIVAFESAFERLLDIVFSEHDSIVAEDSLYVTLQLLKNNSSNQQLFRENSLIPRLPMLVRLLSGNGSDILDDELAGDQQSRNQNDDVQWTAQRVSNIHLLFQVIRALVSPSSSGGGNSTGAAQKAMNACGLLGELCQLLLSGGVPADVLTETINAVGDICRGYQVNQDYFGALVAPSEPPRSAVLVLIMSMANERQPFSMRTAALYCVQCYLYKNDKGKREIIETLLPSSAEGPDITAGHLICSGLVSSDPLVVWFSCCVLLHCVLDSQPVEKERLLRVQMATAVGNAPVSLLQQISTILTQARDLQVRLGVLMLLSAWLKNSPASVAHFLQNSAAVPYLTSQASMTEGDELEALAYGMCAFVLGLCLLYNDDSVEKFNRRSLQQILENRITRGLMVDQLASVSKSEPYARASQKPQPKAKQSSELLFDHEFTKLFRYLESEMSRILHSIDSSAYQAGSRRSKEATPVTVSGGNVDPGFGVGNGGQNDADHHALLNGDLLSALPPQTAEQHHTVVQQYKELIKRQDAEIVALKQRVKDLESQAIANTASSVDTVRRGEEFESKISALQTQLSEKCKLLEEKEQSLNQMKASGVVQGETATTQAAAVNTDALEQQQAEIQRLTGEAARFSSDLGQAKILCTEHEMELSSLRQHCAQWRAFYESQVVPDSQQVVAGLEAQIKDLESQLAYGWQAYEGQTNQLTTATAQYEQAKQQADYNQQWSQYWKSEYEKLLPKLTTAAESIPPPPVENVESDQQDKAALLQDLAVLRKEQEDLLVLCADQDQKLKEYRKILKEHGLSRTGGGQMSEEDDDDECEDEDEDDGQGEEDGAAEGDAETGGGRGIIVADHTGQHHQQQQRQQYSSYEYGEDDRAGPSYYHHQQHLAATNWTGPSSVVPPPPAPSHSEHLTIGVGGMGTRTRADGDDYYDLR